MQGDMTTLRPEPDLGYVPTFYQLLAAQALAGVESHEWATHSTPQALCGKSLAEIAAATAMQRPTDAMPGIDYPAIDRHCNLVFDDTASGLRWAVDPGGCIAVGIYVPCASASRQVLVLDATLERYCGRVVARASGWAPYRQHHVLTLHALVAAVSLPDAAFKAIAPLWAAALPDVGGIAA